MDRGMKRAAIVASIAAALCILGIGAMFVIKRAERSRADLPVLGYISEFSFTTQDGVAFGLEDMYHKISVVDFFFTSCHGPCPVMASNMSKLYKSFEGADNVQFVSISVDPERDSFGVLQDYAERQGVADNRWVFLRAEMERLMEVLQYDYMLPADDLPGMHSTKFILLDGLGQIRGYYSGTDEADMELLKSNIINLARETS